MSNFLRYTALYLVTFIAFGLSWQIASVAAPGGASSALAERAEPAARGVAAVSRYSGETGAVRTTASGQVLAHATGLPVTVVDGGVSVALRVPRGSDVPDVLDEAGVTVGPLDEIHAREDGSVASGDVITVVRVTLSQAVLREAVPFPVETVNDASLPVGRVVVVTAGASGLAENTYLIRAHDGVEAERILLASVAVQAPVAEIRHVGTFRAPPPAGGDIEAIIRAAAAQWGADPVQLLRVAYCESHYNPSAYNPSSGASGLFQFLATTWAANSVRAGYAGASVFDPVANANTAAYMFARGQAGQWACK